MAALVSFLTYFWGFYLTLSGDRAPWTPFLASVLDEKNFSLFLFLLTFYLPIHLIASLIAISLSFVIAFWRPRRHRKNIQTKGKEQASALPPIQTGTPSKTWLVATSLIMVGCIGLAGAVFRTADIDKIILGLVIILFGLYPIAGAYFNWNWFMNNRRARLFVTILSRDGARVFYSLLGLVFIVIGLLMVIGFVDPYATG
jgi:predicted lysophospholipase L1 biosynthesis ABC-type transport system permease subunit